MGGFALLVGGFGLLGLLSAIIRSASAKLSITEQNVILKSGILSTKDLRVPLDMVEALEVEQSIMGRIFGYGAVIYGNGTTSRKFKNIASPKTFRNKVFVQRKSLR